jgi:hypothetical protein
MDKLMQWIDKYQGMNEIDKLQWHLKHNCTCISHFDPDEPDLVLNPDMHSKSCPMHNPQDESWNYVDAYDIIPAI